MNTMLRRFSPLRSAFRSEAKRVMQIFKLSKHVYRSTSPQCESQRPCAWNGLSVIHKQRTLEITNICI